MASPQAQAIADAMRKMRAAVLDGEPTLEQQRAGGEQMAGMTAPPAGVSYELVDLGGGLQGQWIVPEGAADDAVLQYVHGGGYVIGSLASHQKMVGHIAKAAGIRALSVDYRLAPEHPHPAAVNDSVAAYQWLLGQGFSPAKLAIGGDSAGGGLAVATLVALRDGATAQPACAVTLSPWVDLEGVGETMRTKAEVDLIVGEAALKGMAEKYLAGQDARSPLAAPLYASLGGVAPLYIQVGGYETLLDDSTRLAANAARDGVDVRLDVFPEMQHVFQLSAGNVPEADDAVDRLGAYLRARLDV